MSSIIETLRRLQCSDAACGDLRIAMAAKLAIYEIERLTAERDEARRECCNTWEAVMFRPADDVAADKGWDCFAALEETARESYKGGD